MDSDTDMASSSTGRPSRKSARLSRSRNLTLTSSPDSMNPSIRPPTPAPSPTPTQRAPDWSTASEHEDSQIKNTRSMFRDMNREERMRLLGELLNLCDSHELSFVAEFVSPRLKKDPFMVLPTELCLRVGRCTRLVPNYTHDLADTRMCRRPYDARTRLTSVPKMARLGVRRCRLEAALPQVLVPRLLED